VLVHAGNLFEEPVMFEAVKADEPLLAQGNIVPLLTGTAGTLAEYGSRWSQKFAQKNPTTPAFYQGLPLTRGRLKEIEDRIRHFQNAQYSSLALDPVDRNSFRQHFLANVEQILANEPALSPEIKSAILERAGAESSPLGRIRTEVARVYWGRSDIGAVVQRVVRRINVAYFGAGARQLHTWFSLQENAFNDLLRAPTKHTTIVRPLVEMSVTQALDISPEVVLGIQPDDFADIANSAGAKKFRTWLEQAITDASRTLFVDANDVGSQQLRQQEVDDALRDTFSRVIAKAARRRRRIEERILRWGVGGGLFGLGVATDYFTGGLSASVPVGTSIGTAAAGAAKAFVQPRIAPIVTLQAKIHRAADRRD
jgi:hypothetical protein